MAAKKSRSGLSRNTAASVAYILGLITGVVMLVLEPGDVFVRFHATQSVALCVVFLAGMVLLTVIPVVGWVLLPFWWLLMFVFWLVAIVKAWQGVRFKLPIIGNYVEEYLKKK